MVTQWSDDNPYYLAIFEDSGDGLVIDLGERGWMTKFADWVDREGVFSLMRKSDHATVLMVEIGPGDIPYYAARHVGVTGSAGGNEIVAYGIGKTAIDGTMTKLWVMPTGMVCGGDDVDTLGVRLIKVMGPR
jgi:hypothetical protein